MFGIIPSLFPKDRIKANCPGILPGIVPALWIINCFSGKVIRDPAYLRLSKKARFSAPISAPFCGLSNMMALRKLEIHFC
jgi:hypothetical protein